MALPPVSARGVGSSALKFLKLRMLEHAMGDETEATHDRWARLRFSIVGPLLAAPPVQGELAVELARLAAKAWRHPVTGEPVHFGRSTIERWLYAARQERRDPVGVAPATGPEGRRPGPRSEPRPGRGDPSAAPNASRV